MYLFWILGHSLCLFPTRWNFTAFRKSLVSPLGICYPPLRGDAIFTAFSLARYSSLSLRASVTPFCRPDGILSVISGAGPILLPTDEIDYRILLEYGLIVMEAPAAMNGGDGPNSYTNNSSVQKDGSDIIRSLLSKSIHENLIIPQDGSNVEVFRISDLGCSDGLNTLTCIQTIIEAVQHKFKILRQETNLPEFQVFFNDRVTSDFNSLFKTLPSPSQLMVAGVPGSFYNRLFPRASMNIIHSAYAVHWLSKVPEEVTREGSRAYNKGSITYVGGSCSNEVANAFRAQFFEDMETFFRMRSIELVENGLLAIVVPCRPDGTSPSESVEMRMLYWLGSALYDMAKEGKVRESLVDSFNLPLFLPPSPSELKEILSSNNHFTIEVLETVSHPLRYTPDLPRIFKSHGRAAFEGLIDQHFGSGNVDQDDLFERYMENITKHSENLFKGFEVLFLLVKRNSNSV
ncbi:hypothetical protein ACFE04_031138 [Oxalis oulophora]